MNSEKKGGAPNGRGASALEGAPPSLAEDHETGPATAEAARAQLAAWEAANPTAAADLRATATANIAAMGGAAISPRATEAFIAAEYRRLYRERLNGHAPPTTRETIAGGRYRIEE
jgi:hypothetical protein